MHVPTVLLLESVLFVVCNGYPNAAPIAAQTTAAPSSAANTLVGWYTTASGADWDINTCGAGSVWSTSGSYGACAPSTQTGRSLYTSCSGSYLVAGTGNAAFSQACTADWPTCTALYVAQDVNDTSPNTYLICDKSSGFSRRSVYATTPDPSTAAATQTLLSSTSSVAAPTVAASTTANPTSNASAADATAKSTASPIPTPTPHHGLSGGKIAAIVVVLAVVLLLIVGALLWRRRKASRVAGPELEDTSFRPPAELQGDEYAKELSGDEEPAELAASPSVLHPNVRPKKPETVVSMVEVSR